MTFTAGPAGAGTGSIELCRELGRYTGLSLPATLVYKHPTARAIAMLLASSTPYPGALHTRMSSDLQPGMLRTLLATTSSLVADSHSQRPPAALGCVRRCRTKMACSQGNMQRVGVRKPFQCLMWTRLSWQPCSNWSVLTPARTCR